MDTALAPPATAITTKVRLLAGAQPDFAVWQSIFTRAAAEADGFLSLEVILASGGSLDWQLVQRFRSDEALGRWRTGSLRSGLFTELATMRDVDGLELDDEVAPDFHSLSCVTEVITTVVEPGRETAFQAWAQGIQASQASFPGYMGTLVQAPLSAELPYWTTLVRFSLPDQLEAWLGSEERKALLQRADPLTSTWRSHRMASSFDGWFASAPGRASTPAWKQTALVLLVLFPVVMLEIRFLGPVLVGVHPAVATFIGNAISVSLVSWPLMKLAISCLGWWLAPAPGWRTEALGLCALLGLYAVELLTFILLQRTGG